jgi:hypothetical protein
MSSPSALASLSFAVSIAVFTAALHANPLHAALQTPPQTPPPAPDANEGRLEPWQSRAKLAALPTLAPRELTAREADARARAAFSALKDTERQEVLDWLGSECESLGTFQISLVKWARAQPDRPADQWPAAAALTWFDPEKHAPAQPIARTPLDPEAPEVKSVRHRILAALGSRRADSGWMYDYATRELRRLPNESDRVRVFENALLGLPPGWDLAEAWVERMLDDGSLQKTFAAFGHAYTDRNGGVYAGLTLYDAHAARVELEMPDVDSLGLVHEIANDWTTWKAVVSDAKQPSLYAKVGELFTPAHRHRALRTNLARTFLCGTTELRDRYQHNLDNFHWLWESVSSDPAALAKSLPDSAHWAEFLDGTYKKLEAEPAEAVRGFRRHKVLDLDMLKVRERLMYVLEQYGAFARVEPPPTYR